MGLINAVVQHKTVTAKSKSPKKQKRSNIAFKCNFCDGGATAHSLGFNGVCSDKVIDNNVNIKHHIWCSSDECPCSRYINDEISRSELEATMTDGGYCCYESAMLRDWTAFAGFVQIGERKGTPMKLNKVQRGSLAVLTSRLPQTEEQSRFIFAVFLVGESYEGDNREAGYVVANSEFRISLTPKESKELLFWNYYANDVHPENPKWGSGLHRYLEDEQAVQILRDIAQMKNGTPDEQLAQRFLQHFCRNGVDVDAVPEPNGALKRLT